MAESCGHCASVVTRGELVMSAVSGMTFNLATASPRTHQEGRQAHSQCPWRGLRYADTNQLSTYEHSLKADLLLAAVSVGAVGSDEATV